MVRIIHEVYDPVETLVTDHGTYACRVDVAPPETWPGARVELEAHVEDGDSIYIDGDIRHVRAMLAQWLQHVDAIVEELTAEYAAEVVRCRKKRSEGGEHSDGKGGICGG